MRLKPQLEVEANWATLACRARLSDVDSPPVPPATKTPTEALRGGPRAFAGPADGGARSARTRSARGAPSSSAISRPAASSIHDLLLEPPEFVETAKVFDMLLAVPKYGRVKVNKVLVQCRISPSKTIGGLSQRQRTELVSMLRR